MTKSAVLITGANGEIGRSLIRKLAEDGRYDVVTLDLVPIDEPLKRMTVASYAGNIMDKYLLDEIAAHHDADIVFHLAALLSSRGERDPELAHQVNVEGTLHMLRMAQNQAVRLGRSVKFVFPSSIAVYGLPSTEEKAKVGKIREEQWNMPITMYGCNKLYCEHLGRYFARHFTKRLAVDTPPVDFRALRFPGLISADTMPTGGTSDYGPEMLHAAAQNKPYRCFVRPDTRIPFMAMPDAIQALLMLLEAEKLPGTVYNIGAFSVSAAELEARVRRAFPRAEITYEPDLVRNKIVDSWPEDVDDGRARRDFGWKSAFDADRAFEDYLLPGVVGRRWA